MIPKITWGELLEEALNMDKEFLDQEVIVWGDEIGYTIQGFSLLDEDHVSTEEGACPVSLYDVDFYNDEEPHIILKKGYPILHIH